LIDVIPWEVVRDGGFAAAVMFGVWAVLTGRLVPRITHDDVRAQRDRWQDIAITLMRQNGKLMTSAEVATNTFKALEQQITAHTEE
jgi:hypothetical protein